MTAAITAALAYVAVAFGTGFVLGAVREIWLVPRLGGLLAVALEAPTILVIAWIAARRLVARRRIRPGGPRLVMGAVAFVLLQAAECALGLAFDKSVSDQIAALGEPRGMLGLAAQIAFAFLPFFIRNEDPAP